MTALLQPYQKAIVPMCLEEKVVDGPCDDVYVRFHENFACDRERIFAYIYALLPHQADAEDVFQRTSMLLWKKFSQYDGKEGFLPWACTVAHYEVLNFLRTAQRNRLQFDDELINQIADLRKAGQREADDMLDALRCCLQGLKGAEREVVEIAYRSEASLREYAESSGAALQTLYNRVSLARRKLSHEYALTQGMIELRFPANATTIIESPAVFEVSSIGRLLLHTGKCSVHAPDGAQGFRVDTPLGNVVDLGTRFVVDVLTSGATDVHVIEGEADVFPRHPDAVSTDAVSERINLRGGQANRLSAEGNLSSRRSRHLRPNFHWWISPNTLTLASK